MKKALLIITFIFITLSCSKDNGDSYSSEATFVVEQITSVSLSLVSKNLNTLNLPSEIKNEGIYNLKICLKDPAVSNPIINNEFEAELEGVSQKFITDNSGCANIFVSNTNSVNSCEKIDYKLLTIKGRQLYAGNLQIRLAFNNKAKTTQSLIDTRFLNLNSQSDEECQTSKINISYFGVKQIQDSKNLVFDVQMMPSLAEYFRDSSSRITNISSENKFNLRYHLFANIDGENKLVDVYSSSVTSKENGIVDQVKFQINKEIISRASDFSIISEVGLADQTIFKARAYKINSRTIGFEKFTPLQEISNLEFQENEMETKSTMSDEENVELTELIVLSDSVISDNNSNSHKSRKLTVKSCFVDSFSGAAVYNYANKEFVLKIQNPKDVNIEIKSKNLDVNGCLQFSVLLKYAIFAKNTYLSNKINVFVAEKKFEIPIAIHANKNFLDLRKNVLSAQESVGVDHELVVDSISYGQIGNKEDSYFVDRFVQLFFEKKFFVNFNPNVITHNSDSETPVLKGLSFGELTLRYRYYVGIDKEYDNEVLDLSAFKLISTGESKGIISKAGNVYSQFSLPLEVSDALYLSTKGYLVVDVIPTGELEMLAPLQVAIEFYGTSSVDNSKAFTRLNLPDHKLDSLEYAQGLDRLFENSLAKKIDKSSIDLYLNYLKSNFEKFENLKRIDSKEFLSSTQAIDAKITNVDLRLLSQINSIIPKAGGLRVKLCDLMYPALFEVLSRKNCNSQINEVLKISNGSHIEDVVYLNLFEQRNRVATANFDKRLEVNDGDISRGSGFMVSNGDRSGITHGEHSGLSESVSSNIFYDGPPGVFMLSAGISKSHEVFTNSDNTKFQMILNRYSSQLTPIKLNYNSIGLSFPANVKKCTLIENLKDASRSLFICDSDAMKKMITQKWFYIGEADARKHGVLTDGVKVGDKNFLRIIRGEENFKKVWSLFEQEDAKAIIVEMQGQALGERLLEYKSSDKINLEFEINKDFNFPGLLK